MSVSMQAFHTQLFAPAQRTPYWRALSDLPALGRQALSQLALFWVSW